MPGEPSELPQHYGSKAMDGELVKRASSPMIPSSPSRAYQPAPRLTYSPERTPVEVHQYTSSAVEGGGLRRRPSSNNVPQQRRYSQGDYDQRPSFQSESRRPLKARDDGWYRDEVRGYSSRDDYLPHPDAIERSRPPRTYRNIEGWERGPNTASKPYFDDNLRDRDLERGDYSGERKREYEESVDGYNYEQQKNPNRHTIDFKNLTAEERAEVMRLPWTQWMNSNVKNRMLLPSFALRGITNKVQTSSQR